MWWFIALWIISAVAVYFLMPKPETAKPPEVQEVDIAGVEDGKVIPVLFGTRNTESFNVVWWGDVQTRSWEDDLVIGYYYFVGIHAVLFHGPIDNISHIISDDKLAWAGENTGGELCLPKTSADLYGGKERGGGFGGMAYGGDGLGDFDGSGCIDIDMGYPDQIRNWYLEHNLDGGDAVGDTGAHEIPAFRGVTAAILKRVYIGTQPNLRKLSFRGQRVHIRQDGIAQWYDEKSAILLSCSAATATDSSDWRIHIHSVGTHEILPAEAVTVCGIIFRDSNGDSLTLPVDNEDGDYAYAHQEDILLTAEDAFDYYGTSNESLWAGALGEEFPELYLAYHFAGRNVNVRSMDLWCNTGQDGYPGLGYELPLTYDLEFKNDEGAWVSVGSFDDQAIILSTDEYSRYDVTHESSEYEDADEPVYPISMGDVYDMNPSHLIRECLTDPDWGNGNSELSPDEDAFVYAADMLFDEIMGISIKWAAQTSVDDFIDLIKKHINAELYPDHSTGKNILKLIRDDYNPDDLIILGEGDIVKVDNANRPIIGELINSVTVQYWDSCINKDASITVVDQALVQMQGATINTTIQYPGFTNKRIATLAATRDLRVLSSQLLSCTLYVKRTAEVLNLGDVFILHWPDLEIDGIIMRVQGVNFGSGRQNTIKLEVVEDVFGLPAQVVIGGDSEDPSWTDPNQLPVPVDYQASIETPYYDLIQLIGQANLTAQLSNNSDLGYVSAGAVRPENSINAIMATDSGGGYVDVGTLQFAGTVTLSTEVDQIETVWDYDAVIDIGLLDIGSHAEIDNELIRIDAIDSDTETITVARGVLDTSPRKHLADARLLGWGSKRGFDNTEYADSDTINVKLKPVTGKGILDIADATAYPVTMDSRALRPYPPANLLVNSVAYPSDVISNVGTALAVTWAHRDRLTQGITPHTDGDTGPEAGTTYDLTVEDDTQTTQITHADLTGTSQSVDISGLSEGDYMLKIASKRSDVVSWDHIKWEFTIDLTPIFSGTIPNMTAFIDTPFSFDAAPYYLDGGPPTGYSLQNKAAWMSIDNSGEITGTPTIESTSSGITVTASNASGSAASNTFEMEALERGTPITDQLQVLGDWTLTNSTLTKPSEYILTTTTASSVYAEMILTGLTDGDKYIFKAEAYADSANSTVNAARLAIVNVAAAPAGSYITNEDVWEEIEIQFTASGTTQAVYMQCASSSLWGAIGDVAKFRNVMVEGLSGAYDLATDLITNGDFTTNTTGWYGFNATLTADNQELNITRTGVWYSTNQQVSIGSGKSYMLKVDKTSVNNDDFITLAPSSSNNSSSGPVLFGVYNATNAGMSVSSHEFEFVATVDTYLWMGASTSSSDNGTRKFDNISLHPAIWIVV